MLRWHLAYFSLRIFFNIQTLCRWKDYMAGRGIDFSPGKVSRIKKNVRQSFSLKKKKTAYNQMYLTLSLSEAA